MSAGKRGVLLDAAFLALLLVLWAALVGPLVIRERLRGYDIFRDVASAVNIQHGQVLADPAYRGQSIWYPPLSPLLVAGLSALLGISPTDCYRWSQLVFNWLLPAGMFATVRLAWGRRAAVGSTVAMLLAMPWWQCEVAHGQPSIHAVVWGWAALVLYGLYQRTAQWRWAVACGVFQGLSCWHHPFLPVTLAAGFVLQSTYARIRARFRYSAGESGAGLCGEAVILGLMALVASPVFYLMMHGPTLNPVPREYLAAELTTVEFALMGGNPWIWATGLVGLWAAFRGRSWGERVLISVIVVSLLGQVPGYARLAGVGWPRWLPLLVPHEFQRIFQLAWAVCVGIGIDRAVEAARFLLLRRCPRAVPAATALALLLTGVWGIADMPRNVRRYLHAVDWPAAYRNSAAWIRAHTDLNDVFVCDPELAFMWLNPETGRKVWITSPGHGNPRVNWDERNRVLHALRDAATPQQFWHLARQCGIDYCVPSPEWMPRILSDAELRRVAVPTYLEVVYAEAGAPPVLRIVAPAERLRATAATPRGGRQWSGSFSTSTAGWRRTYD